jgi:hypothetical protein
MTTLIPHPDTPCPLVTALTAEVAPGPGGGLALTYVLTGDIDALRIPPAVLRRHRDGLWRHTCFEAFVMAGDGPAYLEFNLSPSGEWAAYTFRAYREGAVLELDMPPDMACETDPGRLVLSAVLPGDRLPAAPRLRLCLSAVLEAQDGRLSYWALRHAPGKPDFHHTDAFALEFSRP